MALGKAFVPDTSDVAGVQNGINILDAVEQNDLLGIVFGNYLMKFCLTCLYVLGYLAGLEFLVKKFVFLLNLYRRQGQQIQNIQINVADKEREFEDHWQSALRAERVRLVPCDDVMNKK